MSIPNPLRSITVRLNTTPVEELPRYARFLASALSDCADTLQKAESQKGDAATLLHKLKTRITSLLQDKTSEGRFTGIVLTKAVVEAGGIQTLSASGTWVRAMLSCLNKQDPPEVKKLCLIALTRIFLLTDNLPTLIREITMPTLPTFITTTLALIKPLSVVKGKAQSTIPSALLQPVLKCWHQLLQHFPSTFRPFVVQIKTIVLDAISNESLSTVNKLSAKNVLVTLHFAAPKNMASVEWLRLYQQTIDSTHDVADRIFRSIVEEWTSVSLRPPPRMNEIVADEVGNGEIDGIGFGSWTGLQTGCSRAIELLQLLHLMLTSKQPSTMELPLATILDLTARFVAVVPNTAQYQLRTRPEIGRDEREELWLQLPHLHAAVLDLLQGLIATFGPLLKPVMSIMVSQLWSISEATAASTEVRTRVYRTLETAFSHSRYVLGPSESANLASIAKSCCADLQKGIMTSTEQRQVEAANGSGSSVNMNLTSQPGGVVLIRPEGEGRTEVYGAAWNLLPLLFQYSSQHLTAKSRSELEATAIVSGHQEAMLSSVLHPSKARKGSKAAPSIIPFLARANYGSLAFDALTRPRMPVIQTTNTIRAGEAGGDTDDEESLDQNEEPPAFHQDVKGSPATVQAGNGVQDADADAEAPVKKRDFAEFEREAAQVADIESEANKRPRKVLTTSQPAEPRPAEPHEGSKTVSTAATSFNEKNIPESAEAILPTVVTGPAQTIEDSSVASGAIQSLPVQSVLDDSDDDEIPFIDTTLTSESEDEDEDDEMDGS